MFEFEDEVCYYYKMYFILDWCCYVNCNAETPRLMVDARVY